MGDKTGISWTDATWNPTKGCEQISPGCRNCYAKSQAARIVRMSKGRPSKYDGLVRIGPKGDACWTGTGLFDSEALTIPLRWRAPRRIFVDSMSDLFFDAFSNEQIAAVFGVMAACPQHTFQILTKRARRMREWFKWIGSLWEPPVRAMNSALDILREGVRLTVNSRSWPLPNVWIGVSVENQAAADERIPELLATPSAVRFLSCEPLIGPLYLTPYLAGIATRGAIAADGSLRERPHPPLDWVIAGCESGPGARPCDVAWLRSIRDQCAAADVPFFVKQIVVDGKLRKEISEFPDDLQIMEFPR